MQDHVSDTMITYIHDGDLFASEMQTIVNAVNCHGAMGKGIAQKFKQKYPDMYTDYHVRCQQQQVTLGKPYLWKETTPWILNFPTKDHWKDRSSLADVTAGLQHLAEHAHEWGITSLAIPALGCGLGGLAWAQVRPLIELYLSPLNIPIKVYAPIIAPQQTPHLSRKRSAITDFFPSGEKTKRGPEKEPSQDRSNDMYLGTSPAPK